MEELGLTKHEEFDGLAQGLLDAWRQELKLEGVSRGGSFLDAAALGFMICRFGVVDYANDRAAVLLGFGSAKELQAAGQEEALKGVVVGERRATYDFKCARTGKYVEVCQQEAQWEGFPALSVTLHDVDERRRQYEALERRALIDPVTEGWNRLAVMDYLEQAVERARKLNRPLGCVFMDLDKFKWVNDTYGHEAGDWVLKETMRRLMEVCRERAADRVARLGGDEFVVVAPMCGAGGGGDLCSRLLNAVKGAEYVWEGAVLPVGTSIGFAALREGEDGARLLKRADDAMYLAKKAGRNCYRLAQE